MTGVQTCALPIFQVFQPFPQALLDEGVGHIWYAAATRGPTSYTTLNTTRGFIERQPEALLRMTRGMYRTLRWIAAHDGAELAHSIAPYFPELPTARLAACCTHYKALGLWNANPVLDRAGFDWLRDAMQGCGAIGRRVTSEECADMHFAEQVVREGLAG